jgi:hypothetical protein
VPADDAKVPSRPEKNPTDGEGSAQSHVTYIPH